MKIVYCARSLSYCFSRRRTLPTCSPSAKCSFIEYILLESTFILSSQTDADSWMYLAPRQRMTVRSFQTELQPPPLRLIITTTTTTTTAASHYYPHHYGYHHHITTTTLPQPSLLQIPALLPLYHILATEVEKKR